MLLDLSPLVLMLIIIVGSLFVIGAMAGGIATLTFQLERERKFAPVLVDEHQRRMEKRQATQAAAAEASIELSPVSQMVAADGPLDEPAPSMGLDNRKFGMWAFIASEIMFFSALIGAYIAFRASGQLIVPEFDTTLPTIGTFILIASSFTAVIALDALQEGYEEPFVLAILGTVILGTVFLTFQGLEWVDLFEKGINPTSGIFGTAFFVLTGFHGLHVAIGIAWLAIALLRAFRGDFTPREFAGIETFGLYWHFVDVVWIVLFTVIYLIA